MRSICESCLYGHNCANPRGCDHYAPIEPIEDAEINEMIEVNRYFFTKESRVYTDHDADLKLKKMK